MVLSRLQQRPRALYFANTFKGCKDFKLPEALDDLLAETLPVAGDSLKKNYESAMGMAQDSKVEKHYRRLSVVISQPLHFYHAAASSTLRSQ